MEGENLPLGTGLVLGCGNASAFAYDFTPHEMGSTLLFCMERILHRSPSGPFRDWCLARNHGGINVSLHERRLRAGDLVLLDDVCLPPGRFKLRPVGALRSHGHNALKWFFKRLGRGKPPAFWVLLVGADDGRHRADMDARVNSKMPRDRARELGLCLPFFARSLLVY